MRRPWAGVLCVVASHLVATSSWAQSPPSGAMVWDTFTAADGTSLKNHWPDIAPPYERFVYQTGQAPWYRVLLQNNRVGLTGGQSFDIWRIDSGVANARIGVDLRTTSGTPNGGIVFRIHDTNYYYVVRLPGPTLWRHDGSSVRYLGSAGQTVSPGQTYRLEVQTNGPQIQIYWNGVYQFGATDSTYQGETRVGLWWNPD